MVRVIAHKNKVNTIPQFLKEIMACEEHLEGVMLDVVKTKDDVLLVLSNALNEEEITTIEESLLEEIKNISFILLQDALIALEGFKKKILLNLLPLKESGLIEEFENVVRENKEYTILVDEVIRKFDSLTIYLSSQSYNLLYQIKRYLTTKSPIGVNLSLFNNNYIDVDFYIFPKEMLNKTILKQQLDLGKEVMLLMQSCDDIEVVMKYMMENFQDEKERNKFQYITNYSRLFLMVNDDEKEK